MRILILHNYYQDPGGEDFVFTQEIESLKRYEEIEILTFKNKKRLFGVIQNLFLPLNIFAWKRILRKIQKFQPDVVHIHNIHYAIGPWFIRKLHKKKIKMVMTIHNYRLICPSAILFHNGSIYTRSINPHFPWQAIADRIVDNSYLKTFWYSFTNHLHRRLNTWNLIDRYLVLTDFAKEVFINAEFPVDKEKFLVKPNYIRNNHISLSSKPKDNGNSNFLFIGRLTEEKGIKTLIKCFQNSSLDLHIAGDGPLKNYVEQISLKFPHIKYLGTLNKQEIEKELLQCKALIFPSLWFEGMPMTLIEAFQTGTPVIASNLGAMKSMVIPKKNGFLFEAGNYEDLQTKINELRNLNEYDYLSLQKSTYQSYLDNYSEERNTELLLSIYQSTLNSTD